MLVPWAFLVLIDVHPLVVRSAILLLCRVEGCVVDQSANMHAQRI